jgi:hypothetical protein
MCRACHDAVGLGCVRVEGAHDSAGGARAFICMRAEQSVGVVQLTAREARTGAGVSAHFGFDAASFVGHECRER